MTKKTTTIAALAVLLVGLGLVLRNRPAKAAAPVVDPNGFNWWPQGDTGDDSFAPF